MLIDQDEINSLLAQAEDLADEAAETLAAPPPPPPPTRAVKLPQAPEIRRLLRISVPVIVQLAVRTMPVSSIRSMAPGAIIEFEKSVEEELDLMINNRLIGHGTCVKVGENFGLRISSIKPPAQRIRSMGADS